MSGKTELGISYELMGLLGFSRAEVTAGLPAFWERYPHELQRTLAPETTTVHPGVREVVAAVAASEDMVLGLLTGNCEAAARIKLHTAGLDGFALGVFGEGHERREALPPLALEEARRRYGEPFAGSALVIVGDTPNDIACGRPLQARSIAVATGRFDTGALAAHDPDFLFPDLSDATRVLGAIRAG
jgi:phosphoglycolate phosphatase-like HAD superfamily hydrolase